MTKVKIVVTLLKNSPIISQTVASISVVMNDEKLRKKYEMTQTAIVGASEDESLIRGLANNADLENSVTIDFAKIAADHNIIVIVRNGVDFDAEQFEEVVEEAAGATTTRIVAAPARSGQLWRHGSFINGEFMPKLVKTKPDGVVDYAEFCLAAVAASSLGFIKLGAGITESACVTKDDGGLEFEWFGFDKAICLANLDDVDVTISLSKTPVSFEPASDVHSAFHALVASESQRSGLTNPKDVKVDAKALLGEYLAAHKAGDIKTMHQNVSTIAMVMLNTLQKMGCVVDNNLGLDEMMSLGFASAPTPAGAESPVTVAPPENVTEFPVKK